jgi:predicted RNase H-like HicB family nuclease
MKKYLMVIEETGTGYSAYSPGLPGCKATGATQTEVEKNIREAIALHQEGLREEGEPGPRAGQLFVTLSFPLEGK